MKLGGWALSAAVAQRRIIYFQFALVAVLAFGVTAMTAYRVAATTAGIRQTIEDATPAGRVAEVSTDLGPDAGAQREAAAVLFRRLFGGVAVDVDRRVTAGPFVVGSVGLPPRTKLSFGTYDGLDDHARVLSGSWPPKAGGARLPLAMLDRTAAALQLAVGDTVDIDVDTGRLTGQLTAVLAPLSPTDPLLADSQAGFMAVVDQGGLQRLSKAGTVTWTISPDSTSFAAEQVRPLLMALRSLRQASNNDVEVNAGSVREAGGLVGTLALIDASLAAAAAVTPIPISLIGATGLVLIIELSALLGRARRSETAVLASRGLRIRRLVGGAVVEALAVSIPAAGVGVAVASLVVGGVSPAPSLIWSGLIIGTAAMTSGLLCLRDTVDAGFAAAGRTRVLVTAGPVGLLVAGSVISVWRFRYLDSAVVTGADGTTSIDQIAVLAPVLCLLALALAGATLGGLLTSLASTIFARRPGPSVLPIREIARRWPAFGTVTLVIGLAVAGSVVAASFDRTWHDFRLLAARFGNAADIRVQLPGVTDVGVGSADSAATFAGLPAVLAATDALVTDTSVGNRSIQLMALAAGRMPQVLPTAAGAFDPSAASLALAGEVSGLALPAGTRHVRVRLSVTADRLDREGSAATADPSVLTFVIWFADAQGRVVPAGLGEVRLSTSAGGRTATAGPTLDAEVPSGAAAGRRIVAIDSISDGSSAAGFTVDIAGITATGGVATSTGGVAPSVPIDPKTVWSAKSLGLPDDQLDLTGRGAGRIGWTGVLPASTGTVTVRLLPAAAGLAAVPVVVDSALAQQLGLTVGAPLDLQLAATDRHVQARVAMVSPVLPGPAGGQRVLADLGTVMTALLRTTTAIPAANQVWLTSGSTRVSSLAAAGVGGPGAIVTEVGAGTAAAVIRPVGVIFLAAAGVGLLLALMALATLATTLAGSRRGDAAVLTSLGMSARRQAGLRRRELLVAGLLAAVLGIAEGAVTAELTVGGLARSAVIGSGDLAAHVVAASLSWLLLGPGLVGATVVVLFYGRRIRGQAEADGTRAVTG